MTAALIASVARTFICVSRDPNPNASKNKWFGLAQNNHATQATSGIARTITDAPTLSSDASDSGKTKVDHITTSRVMNA